ncbi:MAG: helicase associated domain-containing protein [Paraclostridium sp.]
MTYSKPRPWRSNLIWIRDKNIKDSNIQEETPLEKRKKIKKKKISKPGLLNRNLGKWERNYSELKRYMEQDGKIPTIDTVTSTGYNVGQWINHQIKKYKEGKLEADRKELLEAIPYWSWNICQTDPWERNYSELKKYVEQEGKLPANDTVTSTGCKIGSWMMKQRRNKYKKLEEDKVKLLEAIPYWSWNICQTDT